jgi:hypothetical protein
MVDKGLQLSMNYFAVFQNKRYRKPKGQ